EEDGPPHHERLQVREVPSDDSVLLRGREDDRLGPCGHEPAQELLPGLHGGRREAGFLHEPGAVGGTPAAKPSSQCRSGIYLALRKQYIQGLISDAEASRWVCAAWATSRTSLMTVPSSCGRRSRRAGGRSSW